MHSDEQQSATTKSIFEILILIIAAVEPFDFEWHKQQKISGCFRSVGSYFFRVHGDLSTLPQARSRLGYT